MVERWLAAAAAAADCWLLPPCCRRQSEAEVKARESKLVAALEEAQRLRRLLEEARAASSARAGVSREEHARVVAENSQLAAQVGAAGGMHTARRVVASLQTPACVAAAPTRELLKNAANAAAAIMHLLPAEACGRLQQADRCAAAEYC